MRKMMNKIPDKIFISEQYLINNPSLFKDRSLNIDIKYIRVDKVKEIIDRIDRDILEPDKIYIHTDHLCGLLKE